MTRTDLQKLAEMRIKEARILLKAKQYAGAYYLAGYAVECGLKACIAKKTRRHDFPDKRLVTDSYTHSLEKLLSILRLEAEIKANPNLALRWAVVKDWNEDARYVWKRPRVEAEALCDAITDQTHGVLQWIKSHW